MLWGFPGGSVGKEPACNARDLDLIPRSGRYPRGGNGKLLQRIPWAEKLQVTV